MAGGKRICPNCFEPEYQDGTCLQCGYQEKFDSRSEMALPVGTVLNNRYILGKVLGEGGFGITYKACDTASGGVCAIKEYTPSGLCCRLEDHKTMGPESVDKEDQYHNGLTRFLEEAQILSRLGQVPSVVNITDCFKENQTAYFSMEFLDGATLRQIVKASKSRLPVSETTNIVLQVAMAMDIIHQKTHILHRDISPENIYITKDKKIKIIDFGSARQNTSGMDGEHSVVLKLKFAPPEQFSPKMKQGSYTDVFALASTYYYALTGTYLPSAMDRLCGKTYVPLKQVGISVSEELSDAVDKGLELNYQNRTQTMQAFIEGITERKVIPITAPRIQLVKRKLPYVEIVSGGQKGRLWVIPPNTEMKLGRSLTDNNIVITGHPEISKVHCIILYEESQDTFYIRDMSKNGVFTNGVRLQREKTYKLKAASDIALASNACVIKVGVKYESS